MSSFSFLSTIRFVCPRGQPGPAWLRHSGDCDKSSGFHAIEFVSAVIEWGSYPFPSRTRKSSPRSPMVPGPRIRESRSPLDSRPLDGKPSRGLFLLVTPDLFRGRPTQNPSQKRFPSQKCHSLQIRSRPRLSSRPLCRDRLTRYPIADTFPLAETLLITDTVPIADTISLAFLTPKTYNLFFTSY